jgi:hypothetical protein
VGLCETCTWCGRADSPCAAHFVSGGLWAVMMNPSTAKPLARSAFVRDGWWVYGDKVHACSWWRPDPHDAVVKLLALLPW